MQRPSGRALQAAASATCGTGTNSGRRIVPTLFSTSPFSLPGRELQKEHEKP